MASPEKGNPSKRVEENFLVIKVLSGLLKFVTIFGGYV